MTEIESVSVEEEAPPGHVEAVEAAFRRAGFTVEVTPNYGRRAAGDLPWIVQVTLASPIAAFFVTFGSEAGKDAYAAVKAWVKDLWTVREGAGTGEGSVVVVDLDHTNLILHTSIPDEALDALRELDWDAARGDYLTWDDARREWRDPMKQAKS